MNYEEYLLSEKWQVKRQAALEYAGHRCQVCNSPDNLEVHHRSYERLNHELPSDLTVLCHDCHKLFSSRHPRAPFWYLRQLGFNIEVPVYD